MNTIKLRFRTLLYRTALITISFAACKKGDVAHPGTPPPEDAEGFFHTKVRASVVVGDVTYDSIAVPFTITSWDKNGVAYRKDTLLAPGVNDLVLLKSHVKYRLFFSKWNTRKDTLLAKADLKETVVYQLRATKAPKLLKEEVTYHYVSGTYKPIAKEDYTYVDGRLQEITFSQFFQHGSEGQFEVVKKEQLRFTGPRLSHAKEIYFFDPGAEPAEKTFLYDAAGRLERINIVYPSESYAYRYEHDTVADQTVRVYVDGFPNPSGRYYQLTFNQGNRIENRTVTHIDNYGYTYTYDESINPYVHTNWMDTWYARQSKNNIKTERFFSGGVVSQEARFEYEYDSDGYVTQVIRKEGTPGGNDFVTVSKKEFRY